MDILLLLFDTVIRIIILLLNDFNILSRLVVQLRLEFDDC